MNRMQRRAQEKAQRQSLIRDYRKGAKIAGMIQNGIMPGDLDAKFEEGRAHGFKEASLPMFKTCIAAACLMLKETYDMDEEAIFEGVSALGNKIIYCLNNQDLVEEALEKTGITIDMDDSLETIKQR